MHSHGQRLALVGNRVDVSEDVDREAACSKRLWRKTVSDRPNLTAKLGRCHTGSMAILTPCTCKSAVITLPSTFSRPSVTAS
mmetsp:Transcript_3673/g.9528  ORF Transcript_3673/g.9528 Transcript_3673/m.9528 type:complete len:82 (-) Transcript_3673:1753-1998(-)